MGIGWWVAGAVGVVGLGWLWRRRSVELPDGDDDGTLVRLVESRHKIEAIRRFRARHGGGLKDAREAVERLTRGGKAALPAPPALPEATAEIAALVREGRHVEAIKAYREALPGTDLVTAKAAVEQVRRRLGR